MPPRRAPAPVTAPTLEDQLGLETVAVMKEKIDVVTARKVLHHPEFASLMVDRVRKDGTVVKDLTTFRAYTKALSTALFLGDEGAETPYLPVKYTRLKYGRYKAFVDIEGADRCFPVFQTMWQEMRAAAADKYYYDLDMINAQPTIMLGLCKNNRIATPLLESYVNDRTHWFNLVQEATGCTKAAAKQLFIRMMFGGKIKGWTRDNQIEENQAPQEVRDLCAELETASRALLNLKEHQDYVQWFDKVYVPYRRQQGKAIKNLSEARRSKMAVLLQDYERRCLDTIWELLKEKGATIGGLIHDGLHIERPCEDDGEQCREDMDPEEIEELAREASKAIHIEINLKVKNFEMPLLYMREPEVAATNDDELRAVRPKNWDKTAEHEWTYEELKRWWELDYIKINDNGNFVRLDYNNIEEPVKFQSKEQLKNSWEELKYTGVTKTAKGVWKTERQSFLARWLMDDAKRSFKYADFMPPGCHLRDDCYNIWTGFVAEKYTRTEEGDQLFRDHVLEFIDMLLGRDPILVTYFLDWLAHLIQKPGEKNGVAFLIRGAFGTGKNMLINIIERMIGRFYVASISDPETKLFGRFTGVRAGKLLINIDEANGKDCHEADDKIKSMITESNFQLERKGQESVVMKSFERFIFTSNGENPVHLPATERRFVLIEASTERRNDQDYFGKLIEAYERPDVCRAFFDYLKERDISHRKKWQQERPITEAAMKAYQLNMSHEQRFIIDIIKREFKKGTPGIVYEEQAKKLFDSFNEWLQESNTTYHVTLHKFGLRMREMCNKAAITYLGGHMTVEDKCDAVYYSINIDNAAVFATDQGLIHERELVRSDHKNAPAFRELKAKKSQA